MTSLLTSKSRASIEAGWESGDRLPVLRAAADRIGLPEAVRSGELDLTALLDPDGNELPYQPDASGSEIAIRRLSRLAPDPRSPLWFEYREPGLFSLVVESPLEPLDNEEFVTDRGVRVVLAGGEDAGLLAGPLTGHAGLREFQLALRAARLGTHVGFDQLMCLPLVREMELLDHQIRTAKTVLRRFRGRAMLCDEVGLGKTIEAGLVLNELDLRGLARSVLVLVPPSLIEQWQGELRRKFSLDFVTHDDPKFRERGTAAWSEFDRVIVSTHTAKREPHRSAILARQWDLVIVDEAHHLRNRSTQLWKFASELRKQFMLLLTATPVQNNLDELFNLVTLLEPGLLSTAKQFQRQFVDRRDKLAPRNVDRLHELLAEVMVRNRRSTVGLQFTRRWAKTMSVPLAPDEAGLYRRVTDFVRQHLRTADQRSGLSRMALLSLQMAMGSSTSAAAGTLETMAGNPRLAEDLRGRLQALSAEARTLAVNSKLQRLLQVLGEYPDKMVVFTQFRATQAMLAEQLTAAGHDVAVFHGGLTRLEKEAAIGRFRGPARLLVCTESGSEGRNLQFAHAVCNFDLPWNPMRIEQRIGRLSRIGQTHDVHVFNLVAAGTVEAAVLHLLDAKLSMFELVIGEIDMILGNLDEEQEFQDVVADLWAEAADSDDFSRRMEELGDRLVAAKTAYLEQRRHDDRLFGSRFAPDA